jgi:Fe-S-cluster-containing hydrogenase component 2
LQSMMLRDIHLSIDTERRWACRTCVVGRVCKVRALVRLDPGEPPFIDVSRCYDCRLCIPACPFGAIMVDRANDDRGRPPCRCRTHLRWRSGSADWAGDWGKLRRSHRRQ